MIKFFRSIRQSLLSEGKTGRYIKYAFGEIILVVLGILFALSINNWNEQRKDRLIAKDLLSNIRLDLLSDTIALSNYIEDIPIVIESTKLLLNSTELDSLSANSLIDKLPYVSFPYKIKNKSYEKVINSGITDFFELNELFDEINTYYTSDLNAYNDVKDWDNNDTQKEAEFWFKMGFEIDVFSDVLEAEDEIRFAQREADRKRVFLEHINSANFRNLLKLNIYRKSRFKEILMRTKQRAKELILRIDEQLKE